MSRPTFSFYRVDTGIFTGRAFCGRPEQLAANVPEGCAALEGVFDPLSQRVDLTDPNLPVVVDYVPPKPPDTEDATQEWDATAKRWLARATLVANKKARKLPVQARIDALQATQHEPMRAVLLALGKGKAAPAPALAKVQAVEDAIAPLQATLQAINAAATQAELDAIP